jgi:hypothetical protein
MKRMEILVVVAIAAACFATLLPAPAPAADAYAVDVNTASVMVLPPRAASSLTNWVAAAVSVQGDTFWSGSASYWVWGITSGGTNGSTAPSAALRFQTNGQAYLRLILAGSRGTARVTNTGTNAVWLSEGQAAVSGCGILLAAYGNYADLDTSASVTAITATTNGSSVAVIDR